MSAARVGMPTKLGQMVFTAKASGLRLRRHLRNYRSPVATCHTENPANFPHVLAEVRTPLFTGLTGSERALELGKIQNLRVAARRLDRLCFPPNQVFSFWNEVGKCTKRRGYVLGRQLQEGCLIPAIGGGLCQLSNSLYEAALKAKFEIVERHPHSQIVLGSAAERGMDATVAWNYVDLRFISPKESILTVRLTSDELIVTIRGKEAPSSRRTLLPLIDQRSGLDADRHSCASCGQTDCFREGSASALEAADRTAFLLDEWWPEFEPSLSEFEKPWLYAPLDGVRFKRSAYRFPVQRFEKVKYATVATLLRAYRQRRLPRQGSRLQQTLLENSESLAKAYAAWLDPDVSHVVVSIGLLPFLWRSGALGGRTFDVLMTRDSMAGVQSKLDAAAARHPGRALLSDFRAELYLVESELEALRNAGRLVTPHAEIALAWPNAHLLPWPLPPAKLYRPGPAILFPGPTISRKGAYEVREVARSLGLEVVLLGNELEGPEFWAGVKTRRVSREENWLDGVRAVVLPAVVEHRPRVLLTAIASGCPVIATAACGLGDLPGWTCVAPGDVEELYRACSQAGVA